jgi:ureidoglycolate lyase
MREVVARPLSAEAFARYGVFRDLAAGVPGAVVAAGEGWSDARTETALLAQPGHLGYTVGVALPHAVASMERHLHTREVLFCAGAPVVLPLAMARDGVDRPLASDVEAFLIRPGQVVEMDEGVWHDACHGLVEGTPYHWYATEVEGISNDWIPLDGGAVLVRAEAA